MGKDKEKRGSKCSKESGEVNSPVKDVSDGKVPGKEQLPRTRGSGKSHTSKNPGKDSRNERTGSSGRQLPDFLEPVASDIIPEGNSSFPSRREVYAMFDTRFSAFENKIISLLSVRKKDSSANNAECNESLLNVMADDDETCSYLDTSSPDKRRSWQSERTTSTSVRNVHHVPDSVNITVDTPQHGNAMEDDEELESVPEFWDNMIHSVRNILGIEAEKPQQTARKSSLSQSFSGLPSSKKVTDGPNLPADGIIVNAWKEAEKPLPKITSLKNRHRYQYRWPDEDFDKIGKSPDIDASVSTYISTNKGLKNDHGPRELSASEHKANAALAAIDQSLRIQQRAISHASLILSALSKGLKGESEISDEILSHMLGGLANAIVDIGDLSVRASARCVVTRRNIHIDAMNIPDSAAKNELLKVPLEGDKLFAGQVQEIMHKSSVMIRDVRETSKAYGLQHSGQKRPFSEKSECAAGDGKDSLQVEHRNIRQNMITLPPGVQIPPGAQLVRYKHGQNLGFVIQQPPATSLATGHRMFVRPSSSASPVRPQQIVTVQPPNSAITQQGIPRQVHLSTVVTTATPVPCLVRTSAPGPAIHSTPSGAPQQPPDNVKKCKNFISTLIKLAQSQSPQTIKNVRELIQGLIDGKVEPQTFTEKLQVELRSSPQPYLVPFLKKSLPALRQALIANTMTIDGVKAPPVEVLHPGVSMATLVHPPVPHHPSTQHAAVRGQHIIGIPKIVTAILGKTHHLPGVAGMPASSQSRSTTPHKEKTKYDSLKDDDDINDVATMSGVNLSEETCRDGVQNAEEARLNLSLLLSENSSQGSSSTPKTTSSGPKRKRAEMESPPMSLSGQTDELFSESPVTISSSETSDKVPPKQVKRRRELPQIDVTLLDSDKEKEEEDSDDIIEIKKKKKKKKKRKKKEKKKKKTVMRRNFLCLTSDLTPR